MIISIADFGSIHTALMEVEKNHNHIIVDVTKPLSFEKLSPIAVRDR